MRPRAKLDPPGGSAQQPLGKAGRSAPSARAARGRPAAPGPSRRARSTSAPPARIFGLRRSAPPRRSRRRRTANRWSRPRASGLGALSMWSDRNRPRLSRRAIAGALLERQIVVVLAGQRDAHPAALLQQVGKLLRHGQGQFLFLDRARDAGRAGIAAAMAGVDQHDRAARAAAPRGPGRRRPPRADRASGRRCRASPISAIASPTTPVRPRAGSQRQQARPQPAAPRRRAKPTCPAPVHPSPARLSARQAAAAKCGHCARLFDGRNGCGRRGAGANRACPSGLFGRTPAATIRSDRGIQG